ncbi:MAG TPA: hypothetical protein VFG41_05300 [Sphingomicrobium sp.]|jgi:hypothetical protein|nr:hypothetical protein [Sphingomicrobium sp.]
MAVIERHPEIDDYFIELPLDQIARRGGVADIFEQGRLILLKDYRLPVDHAAFEALSKSLDAIGDPESRRRIKKLTAPLFFEAKALRMRGGYPVFSDDVRQAIYDVLCRRDRKLFDRAAAALSSAHEELLRIFESCFPNYDAFRFIPSARLTRTLFENLHWDNHAIDDDFHQARIFANLDSRARIWNVSHPFPHWLREHYREHDLGRFAGKDPNLLLDYIAGEVLGGTQNTWMDNQPRHKVAFEPGEVWLGESRLISHQIVYGESALVYMWFVRKESMANPENRFNRRVEAIHQEMAKLAAA